MNNAKRIILATFAATLCAVTYAAPLSLDISSLSNAWNEAGVSSYKCKSAFRDFGKGIADANAESVAKRMKLDTTARVYLKQHMEKAQAEGDLDKVLVFKTALESARSGAIAGNDEAIVKFRESYEKQLVLADRALLAAGLTAARALTGTLEWQKSEVTKKGDITDAQKIVAFQKKVEEWAKSMQKQATLTASAASTAAEPAAKPTVMRPQPRPQPRESLSTNKRLKPEAKVFTIDARNANGTPIGMVKAGSTIEILYVSGKWLAAHHMESPDAKELDYNMHRCVLCKRTDPRQVLAVIPANTRKTPFRCPIYEEEDLALRVYDGEQGYREGYFADNSGSVRYSVCVIPADEEVAAQTARQSAPVAPSMTASRLSDQTLTGTQTDMSVHLTKRPQPYTVREQYLVPQGKELVVDAGVAIIFEKEASLYCEGTLMMNGTEQSPIVCKGKMQVAGYWSGIRLRSEDAVLDWVQISGAAEGIQLNKNPSILNCAIFKNEKSGIHIGMDCAGGNARIVNCVIADNGEKGIDCHHGRASFEKCTITRNGKFGMWVGYSGHVQMNDCRIEGNKRDGFCFDAGGQGDVHNSSILGNKGYDVKYTGGGASNFRECYWGQSITRMLQQRGDGANLPNILDGRDSGSGNFVDVAEFLTEPPKDCGATVKW